MITLDEQMRQSKETEGAGELHGMLKKVRENFGLTKEIIEDLNDRAIGNGKPGVPASLADLKDPVIIVPRHTIINVINEHMVPRMAADENKRLIKFYSKITGVDSTGSEYELPDQLLKLARERPRKSGENVLASYMVYEGQLLSFSKDNFSVDLGWTNNGSCRVKTVVFDKREDPDPETGDYWQLEYLPYAVIVEPVDIVDPAIKTTQFGAGIPAGCVAVPLSKESGPMEIPAELLGEHGQPTKLYIQRVGFHIVSTAAATSYFQQGNTVPYPQPVVMDLRFPTTGKVSPASTYVSASRPQSIKQLHLLHPLWTNDWEKKAYIDKALKVFQYGPDTQAVMQYLAKETEKTKAKIADDELHYSTAENPGICAACGMPMTSTAKTSQAETTATGSGIP